MLIQDVVKIIILKINLFEYLTYSVTKMSNIYFLWLI